MHELVIRSLRETERAWAEAALTAELGGRMQARRGELVDVLEGPVLVATRGDRPIGIVSWLVDAAGAIPGATAEVRALVVDADARGHGVGRLLIDAAAAALRESGVRRAWLVTTNDNLAALALYQKAGWQLTALRPGAIDDVRRTIKPAIPEMGEHGIPLRDELELELELSVGPA
jgi:ribosomal protein S18 acetylase RimI-like enzyme